MLFYTIIVDIVFICFVFAVVFLRSRDAGWFRHFTWFLLLTFLVELAGYLCYFVFHRSNHRIYNFFMPIEFCFISWVMFQIFQRFTRSGYIILSMLFLFFLIYSIESISTGFSEYSTKANIIFSICMVTLCLIYYYRLIRSDEYINVFRHADFWIVTGLFVFYFVETASNFFFNYTAAINKSSIYPIRYIIHILLNLILYGCWTYAFICKYKEKISY